MIMKKALLFAGLTAAALSFNSCNKSEIDAVVPGMREVTLHVSTDNTKTTNFGIYTRWAEGDALTAFAAEAGSEEYGDNMKFTFVEDTKFNGTAAIGEGNYDWYLLYPYTSQIATPANTTAGYIYAGSRSDRAQVQEDYNDMSHLDGPNFPLWGQAKDIAADVAPYITMHQALSVVHINVTNGTKAPITVSGVSFTGTEDIVGSYFIDFHGESPVFTPSNKNYVSPTANLTVTNQAELASGEQASFYLGIKPFTAPQGGTLSISVTGSNGIQTKDLVLPSAVAFQAGHEKTLTFTYDQTEATIDFTTVAELNAIAAEVGTTANQKSGTLTDAVVSFVPASNTAIIKDATGSILLYKSGHGLKQGQTFSGDVNVTVLQYNNLYSELTAIDAVFEGEETEVEPEAVSVASIAADYAAWQNAYVLVQDLEVTAVSGKNITVQDGETQYVVFTNFGNATNKVGDVLTVKGTVTKYNTTEEIKVWKAADITVDNEEPSFGAAFNNGTQALEVSASTTTATAHVSGNVAWTATSREQGVTITPASGEGETDIRITFPANDSEEVQYYYVLIQTEASVEPNWYRLDITQKAKGVAPVDGWVRTDIASVASGSRVVIVGTNANGSYAMSNNNGTSAAPAAVAVEISDDVLSSDPESTIQWDVTVENGSYVFTVAGDDTNWLYCTDANNGLRVGTGTDKTFVLDNNYLKNSGRNRYVGIYNNQDWRSYTSINNNIKDQTFALFVSPGGEVPPTPSPEFGATIDSENVSAATTSTTVHVTGNVAWTADATNGASLSATSGTGAQDITVSFPANSTNQEKTYMVIVSTKVAEVPNDVFEFTIHQAAKAVQPAGDEAVDILNNEWTGITGSSYVEKTDLAGSASAAVYSVQAAGGNSAIQLRSNNNNSGVVSTVSGGAVAKVAVTWNSNTQAGRTLNVYGSNSAYNAPSDLYNANTAGELLGTIVCGTSTVVEVSGTYAYVGFRSASSAMYLDEVQITWNTSGEGPAEKLSPELAWTEYTATAEITSNGISFTAPELDNPFGVGGITYSSSKTSVATIDANSGAVTIVGAGQATISAAFAGNETYKAQTVSYALTVTDSRETCATPTFNPAAGAVSANTKVTISCATQGSSIYYTTDGTVPTTSSTKYTAQINVAAAMTIKAIAVKDGYKDSAVASATYTISGGGQATDYSTTYTSNVTLTPGTNGSAAKVVISGVEYEAVKCGTSSKAGNMTVTVPAGTKTLHLHAAAWKGVNGSSLTITGATANPASITLTPDEGIANNSPFTLSGSADSYYFQISLSNISQETTLTFDGSKRFVIWGVNAD